MLYFAYGSNMCEGRLRQRTPSARFRSTARLGSHALRFHKRSKDGSGKADSFFTGDSSDLVWGVVFDIRDEERSALDDAEGRGKGYSLHEVTVTAPSGESFCALAYLADRDAVDPSLEPYSWYTRFVIEGARQHGLPAAYIEAISRVRAKDDPKPERASKNLTIGCSNLDLATFPWVAAPDAWRVVSAKEATSHWLTNTKGPLDPHYDKERWYWARLVVPELRTAQHEFDGWPLVKHARLRDLLATNEAAVLDDSFPRAAQIKVWSKSPAIIVLLDRAGEAHVTDGLCRSFMSLWHGVEHIDGYVFDECADRPLPV